MSKRVADVLIETPQTADVVRWTWLAKVIDQQRGRRRSVRRGRRHGRSVDAAPYRYWRQTPDLRQPAARHDDEWHAVSAVGLQKAHRDRQVICLAGAGRFSILLGDLLLIVQEKLPIKSAVFDNGKLGFIDIEQKAAGLMPLYTDSKNFDFGPDREGDEVVGTEYLEGGGARGARTGLPRPARIGVAQCEGEIDPAGHAAVAFYVAGGRRRHGRL